MQLTRYAVDRHSARQRDVASADSLRAAGSAQVQHQRMVRLESSSEQLHTVLLLFGQVGLWEGGRRRVRESRTSFSCKYALVFQGVLPGTPASSAIRKGPSRPPNSHDKENEAAGSRDESQWFCCLTPPLSPSQTVSYLLSFRTPCSVEIFCLPL